MNSSLKTDSDVDVPQAETLKEESKRIDPLEIPKIPALPLSTKLEQESGKEEPLLAPDTTGGNTRDLQETPRIDVKKDILINDVIKKKTASLVQHSKPGPLPTIKQEPSVASSFKKNPNDDGAAPTTNESPKAL
jgi:hypothetical protein